MIRYMRAGLAVVSLATLLTAAGPVLAGHDGVESTSEGDTVSTPSTTRPTGEEKSVAQTFTTWGIVVAVIIAGGAYWWYRSANKKQDPTLVRGVEGQENTSDKTGHRPAN